MTNQIKKINWSDYKPTNFELSKNGWIVNWFSNFIDCEIIDTDGIKYPSVENYYQAMKTLDMQLRRKIASVNANQAKKIGKLINLRSDWNEIKVGLMKIGLEQKFSKVIWKRKLIETRTQPIIEWNNWGDDFWGVPIKNCIGENKLGILLMNIRDNIKNQNLQRKTIECIYCGQIKKPRFNSDDCNYCEDCEKIANEINEIKNRYV